jgi:tripeptidyl-peptidase-1
MGHNYPVFIGGQSYPVSGTSASSPVFAALVTLVNDARLAAGKTPIGFLNPVLYSEKLAAVFNDITSGDNKCCAGGEGSPVCCEYGFYCSKGWDPVTGLGSVNFSALKQALVAM